MIWVQSDRFLYENKEYCKNDCLLCYLRHCGSLKLETIMLIEIDNRGYAVDVRKLGTFPW